jgi:hypothetical protein
MYSHSAVFDITSAPDARLKSNRLLHTPSILAQKWGECAKWPVDIFANGRFLISKNVAPVPGNPTWLQGLPLSGRTILDHFWPLAAPTVEAETETKGNHSKPLPQGD